MQSSCSQRDTWAISLPIPTAAHEQASEFARWHRQRHKAQQVYCNTLCVLLMREFLIWMGIETDLASSPSWNPVLQFCEDTAALQIEDIGLLECRPVRGMKNLCELPPECWTERIGYVVLALDDSFRSACWLGFVPEVNNGQIRIDQLLPPETLFSYLAQCRQSEVSPESNLQPWSSNGSHRESSTKVLAESMHRPLIVAQTSSESHETNGAHHRTKLIDIGVRLGNQIVVLLIVVLPDAEGRLTVSVRVIPGPGSVVLPDHLRLMLISEVGEELDVVTSLSSDTWIQLQPFSGEWGEQFQVELQLGNQRERIVFSL